MKRLVKEEGNGLWDLESQSSAIPISVSRQGGLIEQAWASNQKYLGLGSGSASLTSCITYGSQPSYFT